MMLGKYTIMIIRQCVKTNSTPVVHIKIADKWMFIPLKIVLIGIDPSPYHNRDITDVTIYGNSLGKIMINLDQLGST